MLSVLLAACTSAQAHICEARFFHNGGVIEIGSSGMLNVSAKLTFSQVKKTSATVCQAQVNGFAKYANDAQAFENGKFKNNAIITIDDEENICLVAKRNIKEGEEIFCGYGKRYWKKHGK